MILTKNLLHTTDSHIKKLKEAGIETVFDLIEHYPRTYENKSNILEHFSFVNIKEKNSVICEIETIASERTKNNKSLIKAILRDKGDFLCEAVWFNQKYLLNQYKAGDKVLIFGKPKYNYGKLSFLSPDIEIYSPANKTIKPIYPEVNYIPSEWFEKKMETLKHFFDEAENILPIEIIRKKGFHLKSANLYKIHFPKNEQEFEEARKELAYEELYRMQYEGLKRKKDLENNSFGNSPKIPLNAELIKDIISHLPYSLTNAQKIVTFQILKDMEREFSAKRLLQGDVGTGKTVVALITAIHAIIEGAVQVALMVPTEILARQHFENIQELLFIYNIKSDLLVGSLTPKQKDEAKARLKSGETQIIIGTHALIQEDVKFAKLGFVIIDEQHRFGVEQRKALEGYISGNPHPYPLHGVPHPSPLHSDGEGASNILHSPCMERGWEGGFDKKLVENPEIPGYIYDLARKLRKIGTQSEEFMWEMLRDRQIGNLKFRRQHPIGRYIADFYCSEIGLVIELDGKIHENITQKEYDRIRDDFMKSGNYTILRIKNDEIINDFESVFNKIISFKNNPPLHAWRGVGGEVSNDERGVDCEISSVHEGVDCEVSSRYKRAEDEVITSSLLGEEGRGEVSNSGKGANNETITTISTRGEGLGVRFQIRGEGRGEGLYPHNLNMTATPIPRTLALTIYGDQDISVISEYPAGRKLIFTKVVKEDRRDEMYRFIEQEVKSGRQVYWISPLVTESETLDIANATQMKENLSYIFPDFNIGLLHGKLKPKEKDEIMSSFMSGEIQILSSTSVVEVGVNNTNATIMCIEAAERFGLSQLHQFRGRVGRGKDQSYCYLFTTKSYTGERLRAMEKTNDGFELSEIDLELRGPGEVYGIRQSGIPDFKIANLKDFELIAEIREDLEEEFGFKKK